MKNLQQHTLGFSIIEVLIGIFVFSLGLVSIYALLASSLSVNSLNKNSIIASNLAREQLELFRNIRDTNYANLKVYNQKQPNQSYTGDSTDLFQAGNFYTLENDINNGDIIVEDIESPLGKEISELFGENIQYGRLCLDNENRYIYCGTGGDTTPFLRYIEIQAVEDDAGNIIEDAFLIISKTSWYERGYHEYELRSIVTDWRRI